MLQDRISGSPSSMPSAQRHSGSCQSKVCTNRTDQEDGNRLSVIEPSPSAPLAMWASLNVCPPGPLGNARAGGEQRREEGMENQTHRKGAFWSLLPKQMK